ncbi:non-ribosomal peptide synthetase, partial [Bacillus thuringiensis]
QNMEMKDIELPEVQIKQYGINNRKAKFDITLNIEEVGNKLICEVEYKSRLYNRKSIEKMLKHYVNVLTSIASNTELRIVDIELLSEDEKKRILVEFNNTYADYQMDKTISKLFEEQVEKTPESLAVVFENERLTYKELNEKSNQLGRMLRAKGVKADSIVGIMVEASLEMIVGIMGVLKAGGAYLPIDAQYPEDRIKYMLDDSQTKIIIQKGNSNSYGIEAVAIDGDFSDHSKDNIEAISDYKDLAYLIYTSGSTGKPKGTMIEQRGLVNYITWANKTYVKNESVDFPLYSSISFDLTVTSIFTPLISGNKIVVYKEQENEPVIRRVFQDNKVGIVKLTPSHLEMIKDIDNSNSSIKRLVVGGESLKTGLAKEVYESFNKNVEIYNEYGPTETVVGCMLYRYDYDKCKSISVPIGKPADNVCIYILDEEKQVIPIGFTGEIYIGGDGVSRGYLSREELTADKFISNPFKPGEKMYRSGDIARWLPDGNVEYLGRMDDQIKIKGYRIELREINNVINSLDGVREAVTLVNGNDENRYLCTYMVLDDGVDLQSIKYNTQNKLPHYMLPNSYVTVDKMPLTINGKVDKQALQKMHRTDEVEKKIPPRNFHENTIAQIWKEVLNLEEIFIDDDFFEMGGNSINVIQVANRLLESLGLEVPYSDLIVYTTVRKLSEYTQTIDSYSSNQFKHAYKINKSTSKRKIFIIHGADGSIFYFRHLAKLLEDDYSVYGLQPKGLKGDEAFPNSYYQMLHDYVKEIRAIQPEGPYIIAGFCIGNFLVNDMGNIFELQGDEVAALLYLDSEAYIENRHYKGLFVYKSILNTIDAWRKIFRKDKMFTLEKFNNLMPKAKPISKDNQLEILKQRSSIQNYYSKTLPINSKYMHLGFAKSPTIVIKSEENNHHLFKEELWRNMVKGELEYYETPGDHETLLLPPYVGRVAEIIKRELPKYCEKDL